MKLFKQKQETTTKLLAYSLAVLILPVTACLILYSVISASTMEKAVFRNMQVSIEQAKNNMDYRMSQTEENAMAILTTVYPYLNTQSSVDDQLAEYREITRVLNEFKGRHMISKLRLCVPGSKLYSNQGDTFYSLDRLLDDPGESGLVSHVKAGTRWLETHDITVTFGDKPTSVITCQTAVSSNVSYDQIVGVLFLDLGVSQINNVLTSGLSDDEEMFLVNGSGKVLSHPDAEKIGQQAFPDNNLIDFETAETGSRVMRIKGQQLLVSYTSLDAADWYLVMTLPRSRIFTAGFFSLDILRLLIFLVIVISFILTLIMIYKMVIQSTLIRINSAINTLENERIEPIERMQGTFSLISYKNKPSSLITLEKNANRMVMTIKALLDRQYRSQIALRDYHMQALQAQINPHFLYNTLDIIKWMIIDDEKDDSIWMVNALSKYFQLSLSGGRDIVQIKEEIALTKTYLGIMQRRFKNVFTTEFDIDPTAEECLVPKLSLQPIIENALLHGILYSEKPEQILRIHVRRDENQIVITVEDNGNGIDDQTLQAIHEGNGTSNSFGLTNVRGRLELFGASENCLEISSQKGVGTQVTLRFPVKILLVTEKINTAGH